MADLTAPPPNMTAEEAARWWNAGNWRDLRRVAREGVFAPWGTSSTTSQAVTTTPVTSVVTGIDPSEIANALYGKIIPLSALGLARIGTAGLIFGPYGMANGTASFAVSFGFPANVEGTRRVYEIALDGKVAWELAAGSAAGDLDPAGFIGDPFACRFYSGTMTQPADALEIDMFGDEAVAYRPQMMLWFTDLPVAAFDNRVPFVSCKIGDVTDGAVPADGINLGEALERVAASPWLELEFETSGVQDIVQGMILTEDQSFLDLLQVVARVYRTLDILQTDMLRVRDRGSTVTPDVVLERDHITADAGVSYFRQEESSVPRELELVTIDPDADYVFMPSKAARPRAPVAVTSSVSKDSIILPVVIGATTRMSLVTFAKYQEDNARRRVSLQTMLFGYALEPGDLFRISNVAADFDQGEVWKVVESSHGANYINEIQGEAILKCAIAFEDDDTGDVILLLHANSGSPVVDSSSYHWSMSAIGGVTIDAAEKVYGAASFLFDGTGDAVDGPSTVEPVWNISPTNIGAPYTIELWARFAELPPVGHHQVLIARYAGIVGRYWIVFIQMGTSEVRYQTSNDGSGTVTGLTVTSGAGLVEDTWYHIAVDKSSTGTVRIYVNGVMKGSSTPADSTIGYGLASTTVGNDGLFGNGLKGNVDDVRVTRVSRYGDTFGDSSFTPPPAQFPDPA